MFVNVIVIADLVIVMFSDSVLVIISVTASVIVISNLFSRHDSK
jgi:hypothetical protein